MVAATGDVFNMGSNRVLNGTTRPGSAFQRPLFVGRNTLRAPGQFEMNARYSRLFPVRETNELRVHRGEHERDEPAECDRAEFHGHAWMRRATSSRPPTLAPTSLARPAPDAIGAAV